MPSQRFSRRHLMNLLASAGLGAAFASRTIADEFGAAPPNGKVPENKLISTPDLPRYPAQLVDGKVIQPQRPLTTIHETDVLVVGAGPAGWAAAVSAARAGVKTTLVERYGYFGGQWTGGMVLLVIATHAKTPSGHVKVLRGVGDELIERLRNVRGGVVGKPPADPTVDPEATKYLMDEMVTEAGVKVFLHCWAADVVMDGPLLRGVVFESKAGRHAMLAKVIIDGTGDGDIFAAAGAAHEMRLHAIGLVHRLGNVDRADRNKLKDAGFRNFGHDTPLPGVTWVNLRGPSTNCLDIEEMTRLEMEHRRSIWKRVAKLRETAGGESAYLLNTAPQLGVRISRLLAGTQQLTHSDARAHRKWPDTVGVGGAGWGEWPIPYGAMLPQKLDGLLAAGRCICVDEKLIEDMRLITPCLITGHAAGAAAAVAVQSRCKPRDVDIAKVQKLLVQQDAYLG